ncbi:unnamed protein product [Gadus morhua 'NCC']
MKREAPDQQGHLTLHKRCAGLDPHRRKRHEPRVREGSSPGFERARAPGDSGLEPRVTEGSSPGDRGLELQRRKRHEPRYLPCPHG